MNNFKEKADLIWRVADLLRGDYKQSDYGKVILRMTVIRTYLSDYLHKHFNTTFHDYVNSFRVECV